MDAILVFGNERQTMQRTTSPPTELSESLVAMEIRANGERTTDSFVKPACAVLHGGLSGRPGRLYGRGLFTRFHVLFLHTLDEVVKKRDRRDSVPQIVTPKVESR